MSSRLPSLMEILEVRAEREGQNAMVALGAAALLVAAGGGVP